MLTYHANDVTIYFDATYAHYTDADGYTHTFSAHPDYPTPLAYALAHSSTGE